MRKKQSHKQAKDIVISTRLTETEYADLLLKISDGSDNLIMKPSEYLRAAATSISVKIVDVEVERYKAFIAAKLSNNVNQIARRLHQHHHSGNVGDVTYKAVLDEFKKLNDELTGVLAPIRE